MLRIILFNIFQAIKDLALFGVFMSFFVLNGWWIFVGIFVCFVICIVFVILMSLVQKEFKYHKAYKFFNKCYEVSFYVCGIRYLIDLAQNEQVKEGYFIAFALFLLGLIGKMIFTKDE